MKHVGDYSYSTMNEDNLFSDETLRPYSLSKFEMLLAQYKRAVYERVYVYKPVSLVSYVKR